jgi:hypothetical protein
VAVVAGYFGLDYLSGQSPANAAPAPPPSNSSGDYSAAIASATADAAGGTGLSADEARRIGEQVAREVAAQVAQSIVDQKLSGGGSNASALTEAEARRIGEEEGRRVAQEVAAATIQQAMAATTGSSGGLTAAEAEQIGLAAGRRAAQQVAASTARDVVRHEFGGSIQTAQADHSTSENAPSAETVAAAEPTPAASGTATSAPHHRLPGADALRAWWTAPAAGDFGLIYAGQPKGESAIALLFSGTPNDATLSESVKVYDDKGTLVSGTWEPAANPRLALLRGLAPGRYTVVLDKSLADANGKSVDKAQHGPVYVL